jgi:hypothetical protein
MVLSQERKTTVWLFVEDEFALFGAAEAVGLAAVVDQGFGLVSEEVGGVPDPLG